MTDLLMAGCLQALGLAAGLAFVIGLFGGATVKRGQPDRMSDSWRASQWQRDERTRRD